VEGRERGNKRGPFYHSWVVVVKFMVSRNCFVLDVDWLCSALCILGCESRICLPRPQGSGRLSRKIVQPGLFVPAGCDSLWCSSPWSRRKSRHGFTCVRKVSACCFLVKSCNLLVAGLIPSITRHSTSNDALFFVCI
jgi:hypothetical protein